ncbi:unnamed protein product [marine sediment metagenome]|uniref:Uncharacterized protein n=1 Tax=marine sediment metagenome TaxID=412755 RepID=X1Q5D4_9ZZZZ
MRLLRLPKASVIKQKENNKDATTRYVATNFGYGFKVSDL